MDGRTPPWAYASFLLAFRGCDGGPHALVSLDEVAGSAANVTRRLGGSRSARRHCTTVQVVAFLLAACNSAPPEPTNDSPSARPAQTAKTLEWTPPPTWNVDRTADRGTYRAKYTIPTQGDSKNPGELLVRHLGSGAKADPAPEIASFLGEWEGSGKDDVKREKLTVGDMEVELAEIAATYRYPMGPPVGPMKKVAAHVIKEGWRGIVAAVRTKDRGNWIFTLIGPTDTVEGARGAFRTMLEGMH
jgi:hypothetical protein